MLMNVVSVEVARLAIVVVYIDQIYHRCCNLYFHNLDPCVAVVDVDVDVWDWVFCMDYCDDSGRS